MVALVASFCSYACGVCGSSGGNQYLGLLPQNRQNFLGLQYQLREFTSEHPAHEESIFATRSRDQYHAIQLWGRYYITNRIQILAFVPYINNIQRQGNVTNIFSGLGDVTVLANADIITSPADAKWKQLFQAGAGIKLPTGVYDNKAIQSEDGLPNMQPGTKSWDLSINANYTLRKQVMGINVEGAYTFTTANPYEYKYGNKLSTGLLAFYSVKRGHLTLLPQAGAKLDIISADYDNYTYRWKNTLTGGKQAYAVAGLQLYFNKIGFQASYQHPIYQHFASGLVETRYRVETGINLLF